VLCSGQANMLEVFHDGAGAMQRPFRDLWFTVGLADEAAFLQVLSNSALHRTVLYGESSSPIQTPVSIRLHLRAIRSLTARLDDRRPQVQEGLVGAITGLMAHDVRSFMVLLHNVHLS
jgi:hypothetical protein